MNVLVYTGPESLQTSVSRTITALRFALYPHYTVQPITLQSFVSQPWSTSCALLVFPACRDHLEFSNTVVAAIRTYVEKGGALLGLRAGVKYGGFFLGQGEYSLRFQHAQTGSSIYCDFPSGTDENLKRISIVGEDGTSVAGIAEGADVNFEGVDVNGIARVLARRAEDNRVIAAELAVGGGKIALWGVQLEVPVVVEDGSPETRLAEEQRRALFGKTLQSLGLQLPSTSPDQPPYPLPQFLVSAPSKPDIVTRVLQSLELKPPATLQDKNDTFGFHVASEGESLLVHARASSGEDTTRHIVVYENGTLPPTSLTPHFNVQQYFEDLEAAHQKAGRVVGDPWAVGEAFLYGEAVTSTQTLMDK